MVIGRKAGGQNVKTSVARKRGGPSNISKVVGSKGGATIGRNVDMFPAKYSFTGGRGMTPAAIGKVASTGTQTLKDYRRAGK